MLQQVSYKRLSLDLVKIVSEVPQILFIKPHVVYFKPILYIYQYEVRKKSCRFVKSMFYLVHIVVRKY